MKVAELEQGLMYRVGRSWTPQVRACFKDDLGVLDTSINMLSIFGRAPRRHKARLYPVNPAMVYLGIKHLPNKVWGIRKYHWFLAEGKEVGLMGHDVRSLEHV